MPSSSSRYGLVGMAEHGNVTASVPLLPPRAPVHIQRYIIIMSVGQKSSVRSQIQSPISRSSEEKKSLFPLHHIGSRSHHYRPSPEHMPRCPRHLPDGSAYRTGSLSQSHRPRFPSLLWVSLDDQNLHTMTSSVKVLLQVASSWPAGLFPGG